MSLVQEVVSAQEESITLHSITDSYSKLPFGQDLVGFPQPPVSVGGPSPSTHSSQVAPNSVDMMSDESLPCRWTGCTMHFMTPDLLYEHLCDQHVGRKSTNNLNLTCRWNDCRTTTVKRDHITSHIRVHVPLKPHKCSLCGKPFKRPQDLKKHARTHMDDSQAHPPMDQDFDPYLKNPMNVFKHLRPPPAGIPFYQQQSSYYQASASSNHGQANANGNGISTNNNNNNNPYGVYLNSPMPGTTSHATPPPLISQIPPQHNNVPVDLRKRQFDMVDEFFNSAKRRQVEPTSYPQISRSLLPLHDVLSMGAHSSGQLDSTGYLNHNTIPSTSASVPVSSMTTALPQSQAPTSTANATTSAYNPTYALPSVRTQKELTQIEQILDQMQATVYDTVGGTPFSANPNHHPHHHELTLDIHHNNHSPPTIHRPSMSGAESSVPFPDGLNLPSHHHPTSQLAGQSPLTSISSNATPVVTPPSSHPSLSSGHSPTPPSSSSSPPVQHISSSDHDQQQQQQQHQKQQQQHIRNQDKNTYTTVPSMTQNIMSGHANTSSGNMNTGGVPSSAASSQTFLYPVLPSSSTHSLFPNQASTTSLGSLYDSDINRTRYTGTLLQRGPTLAPIKSLRGVEDDEDENQHVQLDITAKTLLEAGEKKASSSLSGPYSTIKTIPVTSTTSTTSSTPTTSTPTTSTSSSTPVPAQYVEERYERYEQWLQNMRLIEHLRSYVRYLLEEMKEKGGEEDPMEADSKGSTSATATSASSSSAPSPSSNLPSSHMSSAAPSPVSSPSIHSQKISSPPSYGVRSLTISSPDDHGKVGGRPGASLYPKIRMPTDTKVNMETQRDKDIKEAQGKEKAKRATGKKSIYPQLPLV